MRIRSLLPSLVLLLLSGAWAQAQAQPFPSHPVTIVVPSVAGGNIDNLARSLAQPLSSALGQPVIVSNRPGASMAMGAQAVVNARPDGHTLLFGSSTALAMNPVMIRKLSYDPLTQLEPISLVAVQPMVILVNTTVPARTLRELVDIAKAKPRGLFYGSTGSSIQLATEYFSAETGIQLEPVNYKGNAEGLIDLTAGRIQVLFDAVPTAVPFVQSGRARALAVTSRTRSPALPDVPTVAELGLPAGFDVNLFFAVMAPAGTPAPVVERLNDEIRKILSTGEMKEQLERQGVESAPSTPAELRERMRAEIDRWRAVVTKAKIKVQD